jgi:chemotaxis protein methyltransferase CheR
MSVAKPQAPDREFAFSKEDFEFLSAVAYEKTGIVLKDHKFDMVYARIARRLRALGLTSVNAYCKLLESEQGHDEMGNLVNAITTNLTSFFREPHHFEHLRKEVLEPFARQTKENRLRIWSAGCSAGAEPYSIAMTMRESIPNLERRDCKILATDIDTSMLDKGRKGEYPEEWIEKIPAPLRKKYVEGNQLNESVRSLISFKPLNLLESWPHKGPFDAIFCRNVVIYFDKETQAPLFDRYANMLKPGGYLYIGHSETLHNICDRFTLVDKTTYQRET